MYQGKTIMILGGGDYQLPAIVKAKEMGLRVVVCDYYPDCPGKRVPGVIGELISTYDYEGVLAAAKKHRIDGILTLCTDYPARVVAYVAEQLGLPGISLEAAMRCTDKTLMRQRLKEKNIPIPRFEIVSSREEYLDRIQTFPEACVVKAVDNSGSRGIKLIENPQDETAVQEAYDYCLPFSRSGALLIEEYMRGAELCIDTLSFGGDCYVIQVADELAKAPPYFTDCGYNQPAFLSPEMMQAARDIARAANLALGNDTGSSCTEVMITREGPKIVEVGPRLSGDYVASHLVPLSTGVDMVQAVIQIALGEIPDIQPKYHRASASRYYLEPLEGRITDIQGLEEAAQVEGVILVQAMKQIGQLAEPLRSSNDRLAVVIAQKDTPEEAIRACEEAVRKIKFIVEPA